MATSSSGGSHPSSRAPEGAAPAPAVVDRQGDLYAEAAATCTGLPPAVLSAIHEVETNRGQTTGPSRAGALGPMQFLPETWAAYGVDGNGDGRADVEDTTDALHGAARYLCANGGGDPSTLPGAVWNYNHSWEYVDRVLALANSPSVG